MPVPRPVILAVVLCLCAAMLSSCEAASGETRRLVWADEFSGPTGGLDPRAWGHETRSPWGDELQCFTDSPDNVDLDGQGHLRITAHADPGHICSDGGVNDYTSGWISTEKRQQWKYGRLEMRAQVPSGFGTWPAFWALGADKPIVDWPQSGEIDVMEYVAADPLHLIGTVHGPTDTGDRWFLQASTDVESPLSDGFHTYAVDWSADELVWSLDGMEYGRVTREQAEEAGNWVFDKPFYLILNVAVGGFLGGPVAADTVFPQSFVVDYVRVYQ